MKKVILSIIVFALILTGVFADKMKYGVTSKMDFDFTINEDADRAGHFEFYPFISGDYLDIKLRAQWLPEYNNVNGFDYLMEFDTTDWHTITNSVLKYFEKITLKSDHLYFKFSRDTSQDDLVYFLPSVDYLLNFGFDFGFIKLNFETTNVYYNSVIDYFESVQQATLGFSIGSKDAGFDLGANLVRYGRYNRVEDIIDHYSNVLTPSVYVGYRTIYGMKVKISGITQFKLKQDGYLPYDDLKDYLNVWAVLLEAEQKKGLFQVSETAFVNKGIPDFKGLNNDDVFFGYATEAAFVFNEGSNLKLSLNIPFALEGGFHILKDGDEATKDSYGLSFSVGASEKLTIGAGVEFKHLVSDIKNSVEFSDIMIASQPWVKLSVGKDMFDTYVKMTMDGFDPFSARISLGVSLTGENEM